MGRNRLVWLQGRITALRQVSLLNVRIPGPSFLGCVKGCVITVFRRRFRRNLLKNFLGNI